MRSFAALAAAALVGALLLHVRGDRSSIARERARAAALASQRDSLIADVQRRDAHQAALVVQRDSITALLTSLRDSVRAIERRRAQSQLTVRSLRTTGALVSRLRQAFPELGDSAWGLITYPLTPRDTIGLEYLTVPAWFAETFVIDRVNAESWLAQREQLLAVDSLRVVAAILGDSILALHTANTRAYEAGYQAAYASYQDASARHLAELRRPRITVGRSLGLITAVGAGFLVARAAHD